MCSFLLILLESLVLNINFTLASLDTYVKSSCLNKFPLEALQGFVVKRNFLSICIICLPNGYYVARSIDVRSKSVRPGPYCSRLRDIIRMTSVFIQSGSHVRDWFVIPLFVTFRWTKLPQMCMD